MAIYGLRVYTLDCEASADAYERVWQRHLTSLPAIGVHIYGMWRPLDKRDQLVVLASMPEGPEAEELERSYFGSPAFLADFDHIEGGFEAFAHKILGVEDTRMEPISASPMR